MSLVELTTALEDALQSLTRYNVEADGWMRERPDGLYVEYARLLWAITHALGRAGVLVVAEGALTGTIEGELRGVRRHTETTLSETVLPGTLTRPALSGLSCDQERDR